jgi:two-component system sensor histidine kinase MprB
MSLRLKLVLALALLAAVASIAIGWFSYTATADRLLVEVDRSLDTALRQIVDSRRPGLPMDADGDGRGYELVVAQVIGGGGERIDFPGTGQLPVDGTDRELAAAARPGLQSRRNVESGDEPYRMLTTSLGGASGAIQIARDLSEYERLLDSLRNRIAIAVGVVVALAGLLGWLVARQVTRRLVRLTATAEEVAATGRLDVPVPVKGQDEAGRLGVAFNEMLAALARSKDDQQRLVQDAGHELRTPLTSLRTNISVLRRHDRLPPETMVKVLDDLDSEARELSNLTNELVDLATDQYADEPLQEVVLADLAERVAARARRRTQREIVVRADRSTVVGRPHLVERAITNLVDNAAKFADGDSPIEVDVQGARVEVLDRGPGIDDADLSHLFDRFYRAVGARGRPGSGLGLAIVKDVAAAHGGTVFAENRPGGGAVIGFRLPPAPPPDPAG